MVFKNVPKRKRAGRMARMAMACKWIKEYNGKNIIKGYTKHFGVDKQCAIKELGLLGVEITEERKKQILEAYNRNIELLRKKKKEKEKLLNSLMDHNEDFSFIASYTPNGVPYGTRWEEMGDIDILNSGFILNGAPNDDDADDMFDNALPF
jgi:hypothetical protein